MSLAVLPRAEPRRAAELARQRLPASYALRLLGLLRPRGLAVEQLLAGTGLEPGAFAGREASLSVAQYGQLIANALRLSGDPGLSYELALASRLTSHGFLGYGLMSCATLGQALQLGLRYLHTRLPFHQIELRREGARLCLEASEALPLGPFRQFGYEHLMAELCQLAASLAEGGGPDDEGLLAQVEIHHDFPEPPHYARYRQRLPRVRHRETGNRLCFPAALLDRPIATADPLSSELAVAQCERELALRGIGRQSLLERARQLMVAEQGRYPELGELAVRLTISPRHLKRRLRALGSGYLPLRDEARRRDALRLLAEPTLAVERIAGLVGYDNPANFTRAFRRWTGQTPRAWRLGAGHANAAREDK
ncbi:MAG: AraC family transcriptional regulator ligand-binding domain-containing protein [Stagnimonas sp.]|nr:AraC family transcriptional regulator ligand-binding domain-containing protein [Stagnimonas sp.]